MYLAAGLAALNVVLLTALSVVWVGNYRTFGTAIILGLSIFGLVLLVENAVALYYFLTMDMLYADGNGTLRDVLTGLRGLQTLALAVLTWATLQ